jgi:hypothetical protein
LATEQPSAVTPQFAFRRVPTGSVDVTFVLLDWSCRESYHFLDYLNRQSILRDRYEVIWIEFYQQRAPELLKRIERAQCEGRHPDVDTYLVLGMPAEVCYHKHLMYNAGLLLARGKIVCFCDSDAIVSPGFVESIANAFEANPNIVLHLDQVRNNDRRFHPFNYPSIEDVTSAGCGNWIDGRPSGLLDTVDPLHTRNYGACMAARRNDLLAIGGADMHQDYLGYICGPYEMTFRLRNYGKQEIWHPSEWTYHVWHPGQGGAYNIAGPSDGKYMAAAALEAIESKRVKPLTEHNLVAERRVGRVTPDHEILAKLIDSRWLMDWNAQRIVSRNQQAGQTHATLRGENSGSQHIGSLAKVFARATATARGTLAKIHLLPLLGHLFWRHIQLRREVAQMYPRVAGRSAGSAQIRKIFALGRLLKRLLPYERFLLRRCWTTLQHLRAKGCSQVALYGGGDAAHIMRTMAPVAGIEVAGTCPFVRPRDASEAIDLWCNQQLANWRGTVVLAALVNSSHHLTALEKLGIGRERVVVLE